MNRQDFLKYVAYLIYLSLIVSCKGDNPNFIHRHPIKNPPEFTDKEKCDNCLMDRNRWARTRYEFQNSKGSFYTCSIYCVVALSMKLEEEPKNIKVAHYLHPERMIDTDKAFYVIGSSAPGTMTKKSKIAFTTKAEAQKFILRYGGKLSTFEDVYTEAKNGVQNLKKK